MSPERFTQHREQFRRLMVIKSVEEVLAMARTLQTLSEMSSEQIKMMADDLRCIYDYKRELGVVKNEPARPDDTEWEAIKNGLL